MAEPANRPDAGNLYAGLPPPGGAEEVITLLCSHAGMRVERIVSTGQASPPGFWYDQAEHEWVVLLKGAARLAIAGESAPRLLAPGDFVHLPAHCRHRVEWTDPSQVSVWLAVFASAAAPGDLPGRNDMAPVPRAS